MAQPNRIVLTAAAADRPSFGCGAGRELAYYDQCLLGSLDSLPRDWRDVIGETDRCVTRLEAAEHEPPSNPQSYVGRAVCRAAGRRRLTRLSGSSAPAGPAFSSTCRVTPPRISWRRRECE